MTPAEILAMASGTYAPATTLLHKAAWIRAAWPRPAVAIGAQPPAWVVPAAPLVSNVDMRRWSGSVWLFARRRGDGGALATGGQLGGAQAGMRIAYRLDPLARRPLAIAARLSSPLEHARGGEAAVGIDWHPLPGNRSVRLSAERRVALGREARDAWSLYAAGGFFEAVGGIEVDGYAQAGVVGARSRDPFADGALRVARPITLGEGRTLRVGAGVWGAAQPGAERLDIGPRAALTLPVAEGRAAATLALDWRIRVAGDARPGSGAALTFAVDL